MYQEKNEQDQVQFPAINEDVEFSAELADEEDREAMQRAQAADERAEQSNENE